MENKISGQTATRDDPAEVSGVLADAQSLWHELCGLTHDRFRLVALETRRAGESLVAMVVAGVMVAILLSSAWMGFVAAAVLGLVENGVAASSAILLAVVSNLLLALLFCAMIRCKSRYLQFPATLRSLQPITPGRRDAEKS